MWINGFSFLCRVLGRGSSPSTKLSSLAWYVPANSGVCSMMGQVNWFRHYHSSKNDDALKRFEEQAYRTFGVLEGQLQSHDGSYVLPGKTMSIVDCHCYPWV